MKSAGERLKAWRDIKNLSQRDASEKLECSQEQISALETGSRKPGRDLAFKIFEVIGIRPTEWNRHGARQPRRA